MKKARNNVYLKSKQDVVCAIKTFFSETLSEIADDLSTRLADNFQRLRPAT